MVREKARACQLCTLPLGHLWQHHQMSLLLHDVVLSGRLFSPVFSIPVMVPLLQQGMLCSCKSRVLLPSAICTLASVCLGTNGAPSLALCSTEACHSYKQTLHLQWACMLLETVTWSGDSGWFFLASQNSATSGAFLASVLC